MKNRQISIDVTECEQYYRVKFSSPLLRDRAKKINGRKYDPDNRFWYWKKSFNVYNDLLKEFKDDSRTFALKAPIPLSDVESVDKINDNSARDINATSLDNATIVREIIDIKKEIKDFKDTDIEQTNTIKILSNQVLEQFSIVQEKIGKNTPNSTTKDTISIVDLFSWGLETNSDGIEQKLGFKPNFNDLIGCLNLFHQKLEESLFNLLDIPKGQRFGYDLFKLIREAGEHDVLDRYHINNLHTFRLYRNICGHGINGTSISQSKQKVVATIALTALSLTWNRLLRR